LKKRKTLPARRAPGISLISANRVPSAVRKRVQGLAGATPPFFL
jgi:hypothetical protein